jgi:U4/U6 small nuclear ribonucleoprotein PRP4
MEVIGSNLQTLDLPSSSLAERQAHAELLLTLEAKKIASSIDVPTLPHDIQDSLRAIGEPVRLFGENNANVRDRLRLCLARIQVAKSSGVETVSIPPFDKAKQHEREEDEKRRELQETQYSRASEELIKAREFISEFSIGRAKKRLDVERKRKWASQRKEQKRLLDSDHQVIEIHKRGEDDEELLLKELEDLNKCCQDRYNRIKDITLEGSQYADGRPLSAITTGRQPGVSTDPCLVATGGWTGSIKLWNGSSSALDLLSTKLVAHEDRIMGVAMYQGKNHCHQLATASIDLTAKLWKINKNDDIIMESDEGHYKTSGEIQNLYNIEEMAVLRGHAARLCKVAYHPSGRFVGTTSFDHTWRLWDVEAGGKELLLQDGHWKEVYGIGFHTDGSLVSTTDFGSVVQVWDLRSGKSACHFLGHAMRVLCTEFSPNGFQLVTAGDDGTMKVWDLRQRKQYASVPAHSRLVTQIKFAHDNYGQNGEYIASCSFDGTGKIWSTRHWKLLSTLRGHEGKVMGIDILDGTDAGIVTCGYDKTMKIWG